MSDETATIKSELERIIDEAVEERCAGLRAERDELRTELARLRKDRDGEQPEADCAKCADYHTSIASPPCSLCGEPCYPCFTPKPEAHPFDRWERGVESRIEALERDTHHHGPRRG